MGPAIFIAVAVSLVFLMAFMIFTCNVAPLFAVIAWAEIISCKLRWQDEDCVVNNEEQGETGRMAPPGKMDEEQPKKESTFNYGMGGDGCE